VVQKRESGREEEEERDEGFISSRRGSITSGSERRVKENLCPHGTHRIALQQPAVGRISHVGCLNGKGRSTAC
jgi:hypothetical protein